MKSEVYAIVDWNCLYDLWNFAEKNRDPDKPNAPYHVYFLFDEKLVRIKKEGEYTYETINIHTKDDSLRGRIEYLEKKVEQLESALDKPLGH